MVKHPACAAAINSSGLVPLAFSKRVVNEYGVFESTPLSLDIVLFPSFSDPIQTAEALRPMSHFLLFADFLWSRLFVVSLGRCIHIRLMSVRSASLLHNHSTQSACKDRLVSGPGPAGHSWRAWRAWRAWRGHFNVNFLQTPIQKMKTTPSLTRNSALLN